MDHSQDNKRIAKNTLLLYVRSIATLLIGIYTSRLTLQMLGVENYGIYNAVAGFIGLFSLMNGGMTQACSRYITYTLGENDVRKSQKIFSISFAIHLGLAVLYLVVAETAGLWFVLEKLNLPEGREWAAMIVYQLAVLSLLLSLMMVPYNSSIIAHERMGAFAWLAIIDVVNKLLLVALLYFVPFDTLIIYAVFLLLSSVFMQYLYWWYCKRNFQECRFTFQRDWGVYKEMGKYAVWTFFGSNAAILAGQGVDLLYNLFFGVIVNAAKGISSQVMGWVTRFVYTIDAAIAPQITKSFAQGDYKYMYYLVKKGSRLSYFLMLFFSMPFLIEASTVLDIWLVEVPQYADIFVQLTIIDTLIGILSNTLVTALLATTNVRNSHLTVGAVQMLTFPLCWLCFVLHGPVYSGLFIAIVVSSVNLFVRLLFLRKQIMVGIMPFVREVLVRVSLVTVIAIIAPVSLHFALEAGWLRLILVGGCCALSSGIAIYLVGLERDEKTFLVNKVHSIVKR